MNENIFSHCLNGCCTLVTRPYVHEHKTYDFKHKFRKSKAGVFFTDPATSKVLVVQSRGMKWGPPKGTLENNETVLEGAIREVYEETGIHLNHFDLQKKTRFDRSTYFYIDRDSTQTNYVVPTEENDNDASGIAWINVNCLCEMYEKGLLDLNYHCKRLLYKRFKILIK